MKDQVRWHIEQTKMLLELHSKKNPNRPFYTETAQKLSERLADLMRELEM